MELQPNEISQWAHEDTVVTGRVTIDKPSAKLLKAVAAAEAAGDLKVKASQDERARMGRAVESDAESLKAQEKAQADGSWQVGSHLAFVTQARQLLAQDDLPEGMRAHLEAQVPVSEAYLKARGEHEHENAVRVALGQPLVEA